jgi:hypothetical protein
MQGLMQKHAEDMQRLIEHQQQTLQQHSDTWAQKMQEIEQENNAAI